MTTTSFAISGRAALDGSIRLGSGAWTARMTLEGETPLEKGSSVKIDFPDDIQEFNGTVLSSYAYGSRTNVEIIGGKGGLSKPTECQQYRNATAKIIINDFLRQGNEVLSPSVDVSILDSNLSNWAAFGRTVGREISALVDWLKLEWSINDKGELWIGTPKWEPTTASYDLVNHDLQYGYLELAPNERSYGIRPGMTIEGGLKITAVTFKAVSFTYRIIVEYSRG